MIRLSSAIAAKSVSGYDDSELTVLRDSIPYTSEAAQGSTFKFFQDDKRSEVLSNFIENPLASNAAHDVLGIGIVPTPGLMTSANSFDVLKAYAALTDATLELSTSDRETLLEADVQQHLPTEQHDIGVNADAGNTTFTVEVDGSNTDLLRLAEPIRIENQEIFELSVESLHSGGIPAAADYTGQSVTTHLQAFMQVAKA